MQYPSKLEQPRDTIAPLPMGLTNDIHPIVGPERFEVSFPYVRIVLVSRLVSRILESPAALHFLYAMFFGISYQVDLSATNDRICIRRECFRLPDGTDLDLNSVQKAAVRAQLLQVSSCIRYYVEKDLGSQASCRIGRLDPRTALAASQSFD